MMTLPGVRVRPACALRHPVAATAWVVGAALAADSLLPLHGCETVSTHAGRHPYWTVGALVVLAVHFNSGRLGLSHLDPLHLLGRRLAG